MHKQNKAKPILSSLNRSTAYRPQYIMSSFVFYLILEDIMNGNYNDYKNSQDFNNHDYLLQCGRNHEIFTNDASSIKRSMRHHLRFCSANQNLSFPCFGIILYLTP